MAHLLNRLHVRATTKTGLIAWKAVSAVVGVTLFQMPRVTGYFRVVSVTCSQIGLRRTINAAPAVSMSLLSSKVRIANLPKMPKIFVVQNI